MLADIARRCSENEQAYDAVYNQPQEHEGHFSHELVGGAAAFYAMRKYALVSNKSRSCYVKCSAARIHRSRIMCICALLIFSTMAWMALYLGWHGVGMTGHLLSQYTDECSPAFVCFSTRICTLMILSGIWVSGAGMTS